MVAPSGVRFASVRIATVRAVVCVFQLPAAGLRFRLVAYRVPGLLLVIAQANTALEVDIPPIAGVRVSLSVHVGSQSSEVVHVPLQVPQVTSIDASSVVLRDDDEFGEFGRSSCPSTHAPTHSHNRVQYLLRELV